MLVGEYPEEADASLQAQYGGRDVIAEFLDGRISARMLRVLIQGLPTTSALVRAVRGHDWGDTEMLLHDLDSLVRFLRTDIAAWATKKKQPNPKLLPTPMDDLKTVEQALEDEYIEQQRDEMQVAIDALFANN